MQRLGGLPKRILSALRLLPPGGASGQVLKKASAADYDATWQADATGGGGGSPSVSDGRLTLSTGVPVMTSTVAATGTLYYTPYIGDKIGLYNGSTWDILTFSETSIALSGGTASKPHDVFGYNNASTFALEILAWTNDTTRATALTRQNGILVKSGTATRRYLGTIYLNGSKQAQWTYGTLAASGGAAQFDVWNMYNRHKVDTTVRDSTDSWVYASAVWREANGSATARVTFVVGVDEDTIFSVYYAIGTGTFALATCLDATNTFSGITGYLALGAAVSASSAGYAGYSGIGRHFLSAVEYAQGSTTFYGDSNTDFVQSGLTVCLMN